MENKEDKSGKEGCCESSEQCRHHRCCSGKAALVLVLLLIGGLIGYGAGRCHSYHSMCRPEMGGAMMQQK